MSPWPWCHRERACFWILHPSLPHLNPNNRATVSLPHFSIHLGSRSADVFVGSASVRADDLFEGDDLLEDDGV
jgi:hypothetical protein